MISFGSAVIDVFVDVSLSEKGGEFRLPIEDKILIDKINFTTGGGGTNTSVSFSKMGLKAGFVGKLGEDENASIILRELKKEKVEFLGVKGKDGHTGYSVVLGGKSGDRTILTHKGINNSLKYNELNLERLSADWFYFSSLIGESFKVMERVVERAYKKGIKIAFNPSSYQAKMGARRLGKILRRTDVLVLNEEEGRALVPRGELLEGLHKLGPKIVCVTLGKNGNMVYDGISKYKSEAHRDIKSVERTGAGDAFASGFVGALIKNRTIEEAIQIGSANAESVIQIPGAKNGLLSWSSALDIIIKRVVKIIKK